MPTLNRARPSAFAMPPVPGYNVLAVPLAAGVLAFAGIVLSPAAGAVKSVSTIVVAANAQLLRRLDLDPRRLTGPPDSGASPAPS